MPFLFPIAIAALTFFSISLLDKETPTAKIARQIKHLKHLQYQAEQSGEFEKCADIRDRITQLNAELEKLGE